MIGRSGSIIASVIAAYPPRAQFANSNRVEHLEHCPMQENVDRKTRRVEPHFDSEEGWASVIGKGLYVQVSVGKCE